MKRAKPKGEMFYTPRMLLGAKLHEAFDRHIGMCHIPTAIKMTKMPIAVCREILETMSKEGLIILKKQQGQLVLFPELEYEWAQWLI